MKGKLEIYYKFDETNVSSFPYQMPIDTTRFKSFKVDGVEYIPQSEGGSSSTTIEMNDVITYNGDATVFTPYLDNALGNGVYSSIKVTVPNFNPETEEIFLVMYAYMDEQTMVQGMPAILQGMLTSVGNGEYEMIPEMVNNINMIFEEYTSYGMDVKIFFLGVESGYSDTSFVSKPTVVEYEGSKMGSYEVIEPCEITVEVEWADTVNENDFFKECFSKNYNLITFNKVLFENVKFNGSLSNMFYNCTGLTSLDLSNWDTSNVTNVDYMFRDCTGLTSLDLSGWDVSNVTNMSYMFYGCSGLTSLNLSDWDVSNVTNMRSMFYGCSGLTSLNLNNWKLGINGFNFYSAGTNTTKITSLDLSNWDVSNVTNMGDMFSGCTSLTSLDLSNWDTSNVTDMGGMFKNCQSLTSLELSNWDTSNVTSMGGMFFYCRSLTSLNLSDWDISNVTNMSGMFYNCKSLTSLDLSNWKLGINGFNFYSAGTNTTKITSLDLSNWDVSNVTNMDYMFEYCSGLTSLDLSNWDTSNVTGMSSMFHSCTGLTSLDLSNWDVSNVTKMPSMFNGCHSLTSVGDLSNWDTSNVTNMGQMFIGCNRLTSVGDLSNWDTSKVTWMSYMFRGCSSLTTLDLSNWDTSNVTVMNDMFEYCTSLIELKMGGNPIKVSDVNSMFDGINTNGTFYYNSAYDYSKIIAKLPSTWTTIPCTMVDGVLIPNE